MPAYLENSAVATGLEKVSVHSNTTRLLCPWDIFRQEYWSGLPFPSPGDLPDRELNPCLLHFLYWQVDSLPLSHLRSPIGIYTHT